MQELLNSLFDTGLYDQLYRAGIIAPKYSTYRNIYLYVSAQMQARGINKEQAVICAEVQFSCSRSTVYRAMKEFTPKIVVSNP